MKDRQRLLAWGVGIALATVCLLLGVYLLRGILLFPVLEKAAVAYLHSETGLLLTVDEMDGSLFGDLDFKEVRITTPASAQTPLDITLPELHLNYRLTALWQGFEVFLGSIAIEAVRPAVRIDLSRPAMKTEAEEAPTPFAGLPPVLPRLTIENGRLAIAGDGYGSRFEDISVVPLENTSGSALGLAIAVADWQWHLPPLRDGGARAGVQLTVQPSGELAIQGLTLDDHVVVEEGRLDLSVWPALPFSVRSPTSGGHLAVDGRLGDGRLQLSARGEKVDLALLDRILAHPDLKDLEGNVQLKADVTLPFERPEHLQGKIDLSAGAGRWRTIGWESATIQAAAQDGRLSVGRAELHNADNRVSIRDLDLPTGPLFQGAAAPLLSELNAAFEMAMTDIPALWSSFETVPLPAGTPVPAHNLDLTGRIRDGVVTLEEGRLTAAEGSVQVQRLEASLTEMMEKGADAAFALHASLDWPELKALTNLLPLPPISGRLRGVVQLEGPWHAPAGTLRLEGEDLAWGGTPWGTLDVNAQSDGRWLTVATARLSNAQDRLDLSGRLALASGDLDAVRLDLAVADMGRYAAIVPLDFRPLEGQVAADLTIEGTLAAPEAAGTIALDAVTVGPVFLNSVRGRLNTDQEGLQVERLTLDAAQVRASLAGRIDYPDASRPLAVLVETLTLERREERLELQAPARIHRLGDGRWRIEEIRLAGSGGRVALIGSVGGGAAMDIAVDLADVRSGAWPAASNSPVRAFEGLTARLELTGSPASPAIHATGRLPRLVLRDWPNPLAGRFAVRTGDEGIVIDEWKWTDGAASRFVAEGRLPVHYDGQWRQRPGPLRLETVLVLEDMAILRGLFPDLPVTRGAAQARIELGGTLAVPNGTIRLDMRDLVLTAAPEGMAQGPFRLNASGRLDPGGISLDRFTVDADWMALEGRGRWRHARPLAAWMAFTDGEAPGEVTASADLRIPDLAWLAGLSPAIQRTSGRLEAALQVEGELPRPSLAGRLVLSGGGLKPRGDAPPVQEIAAELRADDAGVTIQACRGEVGGAPFALTGGLRRGEDRTWTLDLTLDGDNLLLYRTAGLLARADTALTLQGPLARMTLQGEIALTGGRLTRYVNFLGALRADRPSAGVPREILFSLPEPPLKDMVFDVAVTSRTPFRLRNNVINGSVRPDLHLGGTGLLPRLTGVIYVDPSRMRLPAGSLEISSGVVRFPETGTNRPVLELVGQGRMFDYDITALIEGPLEEPRVTLSSAPPLPGDQLMLMLLTGQPPAVDRKGSGIPMNLAVYIGQDLLTQWLGGDTGESWSSVLDRFDVVHGRRVTRSGEETLEARFRLGEDVLKDGDTIYLTGEKDVYDFYNAGLKFVFQFQ